VIKLADYVVQTLSRWGIKHVFMFPGGGAIHLVDSLGKSPKLDFVCNLHEQACAIAAEAYSQCSGNFAAALVTTGPGGTNAVTGVAGAWLDSTPMIVLSGQVKRADLATGRGVRQMGPQELDIISIVKGITKYAVTVCEPADIRYHLEKAFHLAKSGRPGPVWLDIPLDVQSAMIDERRLRRFVPGAAPNIGEGLRRKIAGVIDLLNHASRPVILVGNGVRLAGALKDFRTLVELWNIPVLTTWKAIDFLPDDHRLYVGRPGLIGQRGANFVQQNCDCIIMLGARMDLLQVAFDWKTFAREARKVMVDVDPHEIRKLTCKIDLPICADAKVVIGELLNAKRTLKSRNRIPWLTRCKEWNREYPVVSQQYRREAGVVNLYVLLDVLSDMLTKDDVVVPGSSGQCSEVFLQTFRVKDGQRVFNTPGLGAMGFGLPASIGACLASGRRRTICINGDGGFQLNIQELETVRRLNLPIKFFILINDGYASVKGTQRSSFNSHFVACDASSGLTLPDILKLAEVYGITTARIENHDNLRGRVRKVLGLPGPVICEVSVSMDQIVAPKVISKLNPDGTVTSKPMEDMWPFLDRGEFKANMIVTPMDE
jgi:acetolactate synthase-1/2/3 large subunit